VKSVVFHCDRFQSKHIAVPRPMIPP